MKEAQIFPCLNLIKRLLWLAKILSLIEQVDMVRGLPCLAYSELMHIIYFDLKLILFSIISVWLVSCSKKK